MCFAPHRRALFPHLNFQKWSENRVGLYILTWKRASRRIGVHFSTSQFPKWSENGMFCTFWLGNVLRATTACAFSTSQLLKVLRSWGVLSIFASKCAWRYNGVQFFISHLARWLRARRFSEPTFRPPRATGHWKDTLNRDFFGSFTSKLPSISPYVSILDTTKVLWVHWNPNFDPQGWTQLIPRSAARFWAGDGLGAASWHPTWV